MKKVQNILALNVMVLMLLLICGCATNQKCNKIMNKQTFFEKQSVGKLNYFVDLPNDFDKTKQYPLIVFLHGAGERGTAETKQNTRVTGLPQFIDQGKFEFPFIVVTPQCPTDSNWYEQLAKLEELTEFVIANYPVNKKQVYLTGLSMGGYGTWDLACLRPDLFAALAPICGGGDPKAVTKIKNIPVWCFHGEKDDIIPLKSGQEMVDALHECGGVVKFTIYPNVKHNSWTRTYENSELYNWFLSITKP